MSSFHQNTNAVQVMDLTAESQAQKAKQQALMQQLEVQKAMAAATTNTATTGTGTAGIITVPTLPADVRAALRQLGQPVRLFGENLANVRQRLRLELATRQVIAAASGRDNDALLQQKRPFQQQDAVVEAEEEQVTKYTRAIPELLQARQAITVFSLQRAAARLTRERQQRRSAASVLQKRKRQAVAKITMTTTSLLTSTNDAASPSTTAVRTDTHEQQQQDDENQNQNTTEIRTLGSAAAAALLLDAACRKTYKSCRKLCLAASQFGDVRSLSAICAVAVPAPVVDNDDDHGNMTMNLLLLATASWTGSIHLWNGSTAAMTCLGSKMHCHADRIMWMDVMTTSAAATPTGNSAGSNSGQESSSHSSSIMLATASIDMTAKLWKVQKKADVVMKEDDNDIDNKVDMGSSSLYNITEMVHFKGHAARLCRIAFHPMQRHVGTTSFDHTWRLWDIETGQDLLLQDGHAKEVFGLAFHIDGSLCCTTDFASVVQLWDLRTGKSIQHYAGIAGSSGGHAKRVTCADFSPNGIHLATAGDDGTIKIWDLRKRPSTSAASSSSTSSSPVRVAKNALVANIPAHSRLVTRVKFERNHDANNGSDNGSGLGGEYLVSSSFDGLAKVWSARDWKLLKELQGHDGQVSCVDILPPNNNGGGGGGVGIVTCGFDKTLKLWK